MNISMHTLSDQRFIFCPYALTTVICLNLESSTQIIGSFGNIKTTKKCMVLGMSPWPSLIKPNLLQTTF